MWVADDGTNRIHRFNASGTQIDVIGPTEATPVFQKPEGIAVDGAGTRLWVTDSESDTIYRFDAAGNQTASFPATRRPRSQRRHRPERDRHRPDR